MRKVVKLLIVSAIVVAAAAPVSARADFWDWLFGRISEHRGNKGGTSRGAPAPVTLVGLGLGAGGLAVAAWLRSKRRS